MHYAQFAESLHAYSIHMDKNFINHEYVLDAKTRGLKVFAYTVDKQQDIELMLDLVWMVFWPTSLPNQDVLTTDRCL